MSEKILQQLLQQSQRLAETGIPGKPLSSSQAAATVANLQSRLVDPGDFDTGEVPNGHAPNDHRNALLTMKDEAFLRHTRYQEQQWRANRNGAHLLIIEFEKALVKHMRLLGVPMFAHCVVRTPTEQAARFQEGNSRKNGVGPYPHRHCAADIIHSKYAWNLSKEQWAIIGHCGKEVASFRNIDIVWGGSPEYGFYDPAHWELAHYREREKEVLQ